MFSQADLDEAVAAGVLTPEAASAFREHLERGATPPAVDEENFRLLSGFNDIFVSIAAIILLFSVGFIGQAIGPRGPGGGPAPLAGLLIAGAAWGLALFFIAKRRMALPSILLLLAFVGGLFEAAGSLALIVAGPGATENDESLMGGIAAVAAIVAAGGAWLHWRRFRVPITVAAGAAAVAGLIVSLTATALGPGNGQTETILLGTLLAIGIGIFLVAMRWDSSDPERITRRSDVAFWLHLLAAPMIAHPIFALLGLTRGNASAGEAVLVVLLYVAFGVTALAIDRRALLVSALAYVLYALSSLFSQFGAVELNVALTALVIGSALLLLSAFWHQARRAVVSGLPAALRQHLPATASLRSAPIAPV